MLTLLDWAKERTVNNFFKETFHDRSNYHSIQVPPCWNASSHKELWICFPGFLNLEMSLNRWLGARHILPARGKVYAIKGPDAIAGFTPYDSIEAMRRLEIIVGDIVQRHQAFIINIFSISAGTYPGFYFANKHNASRLIAVSPGPRMGEGIYTSRYSVSLKNLCIEGGFPNAKAYDAIIAPYNQENNIANLPTESNLMIFGGQCDRVILNRGTQEIVEICSRAGKKPLFKNYPLFDHTMLGLWLAGMNRLGLDPYQLKGGPKRVQRRDPEDTPSFSI
jgi:hypothetical protein